MDSVIYACGNSATELSEQWYKSTIWSISNSHGIIGLFGDICNSGKRIQRDLWKAVSFARTQKAAFIITSISNLTFFSSKAIKVIDLLSTGGAFIVCIDEEFNTLQIESKNLMKIIHIFYEMNIQERDKRIYRLKKKKLKNIYSGKAPYGLKKDISSMKMVPNKKEMEVVKKIIDLKKAKHSYRYIARHLTESGDMPRKGIIWHPKVIMDIYNRHTKTRNRKNNSEKNNVINKILSSKLNNQNISAFTMLVDELRTLNGNYPSQYLSNVQYGFKKYIVVD